MRLGLVTRRAVDYGLELPVFLACGGAAQQLYLLQVILGLEPVSLFQPMIPAHTTVDLRLGGEMKNLFWSVAVQNLFNVEYFDYAVASSATFGRYNAYPLPGRTFLVKAGVTF